MVQSRLERHKTTIMLGLQEQSRIQVSSMEAVLPEGLQVGVIDYKDFSNDECYNN
jgi:hypothetical protein